MALKTALEIAMERDVTILWPEDRVARGSYDIDQLNALIRMLWLYRND